MWPFPSGKGTRKIVFYSRGCGAINHLLKALSLSPGEKILLPSYLCRDVIEVFEAAGVTVEYYSIDQTCQFDIQQLEDQIDSDTRLVYVVHYFGFPQNTEEVRRITRRRSVHLVEDCAHSLFGRYQNRWLGEFSDAAIFSIRKVLPVPDGGALLVNNPSIKPPPVNRVHRQKEFFRTAKLLSKGLLWYLQCHPSPILRRLASNEPESVEKGNLSTKFDGCSRMMSDISWKVMKNCEIQTVTSIRRRNFEFYLKSLAGAPFIDSLYTRLPEEVVPFSFPVLVENRDQVLHDLGLRGVFLNNGFPEAPMVSVSNLAGPVDFPGTEFLAQHLLELPVHQDLCQGHLQKVIDVLYLSLSGLPLPK